MKKFRDYIDSMKSIRLFPKREEGQSDEEYAKQRMLLGLKYGVYLLAAFAVLRGVLVTVSTTVTVSNSVNGKELPIYCVETKEPKIALTFDAAWGNEDTKEILDVLKKHDVKVTFFMTGGWVENYPEDVKAMIHSVLRHRIALNYAAVADEVSEERIIDAIIGAIPTP